MNLEELDDETFRAIKKLIKGFCVREVVNEYVLDDSGNKQLTKQKISKIAQDMSIFAKKSILRIKNR